jgi:hypothetical protein
VEAVAVMMFVVAVVVSVVGFVLGWLEPVGFFFVVEVRPCRRHRCLRCRRYRPLECRYPNWVLVALECGPLILGRISTETGLFHIDNRLVDKL